jgi:hypothetical protein
MAERKHPIERHLKYLKERREKVAEQPESEGQKRQLERLDQLIVRREEHVARILEKREKKNPE